MFDSEVLERESSMTVAYSSPAIHTAPLPASYADGHLAIRVLDVSISLIALVFLGPLMVLIAFLVRSHDGGPALFAQKRIGLNGDHFACFKFRSMVTNAGERLQELLDRDPVARAEWEADHKLRNDPRITPLGRFLRKSSLDELPQLLNVLRGEMSLVGPRPIVDGEVVRYGRFFGAYCSVKPGITGLWQISGRNETSYNRRVALDVVFARSKTVGLYLKILFGTIPAVLLSKGAY